MTHPLQLVCLTSLIGLLFCQLSLLLSMQGSFGFYWALILALPLLLPMKGLIVNRLYTYKWVGFLALFYFCVGISELFSNPALQLYAYLTTILSIVLFIASIYYTRYLRLKS
ncbi:MAG: DUF2069 domain-containing protein [Gammaproteobacteria bacterium]|jgi:uncharacterized membrane protein|nr:DUF2069 domain-containing protein [Gammaproteobacteria bacterium]MCZ6797011.1 DUF2069 domain-containing protein [Gammaproteobacteria bacterium]